MDDRLIALDRTLLLLGEHLAATASEIAAELERSVVAIRVAAELAGKRESQAAVAALVNLLVRTGLRVQIEAPDVESRTPLLRGSLPGALVAFGDRIFAGSVRTGASAPADVAIVLGSAKPAPAVRQMWLAADRRGGGFASSPESFAPADILAAMEPACMAAAECIRFALRRLPARTPTDRAWLESVLAARLPSPAAPDGAIDIGALDAISAGAIIDAALYTMLARDSVSGDLRIFDDGRYELSNLNRYPLLDRRIALTGLGKAIHLASLDFGGLELTAIDRRFALSDVRDARRRILVGADDIGVRHLAADAEPDWLGIGATGHDEVRVTEHEPDESCARCAHPHVGPADHAPIPTIAPVSFQAGLRLTSRLLRFAAGQATPPSERYATYWPLRPGTTIAASTPPHPACPVHGTTTKAA